MKLKKIKYENIFLIFIIYQFIYWLSNNALNKYSIIYYIFVIIIYFTIKFLRKNEKNKKKEN